MAEVQVCLASDQRLANVIPVDEALGYLKDQIQQIFGRKSQKIVEMNFAAVDHTL